MTSDSRLKTSDLTRCRWCGTDPLYMKYHDKEWGKTVHNDDTFFEFLTLEAAQAGLSSFQHIGILSLEFHVDKLSRPLL